MPKSPDAFRSISEAAEELGLPQHVLRFWETKFRFVQPTKTAGGRRFYRPSDIHILATIKHLVREDGHSLTEVQALYRQRGAKGFVRPPAIPARTGMTLAFQSALEELEAAKARLDGLLTAT